MSGPLTSVRQTCHSVLTHHCHSSALVTALAQVQVSFSAVNKIQTVVRIDQSVQSMLLSLRNSLSATVPQKSARFQLNFQEK
eukprot:1436937-Amphidinium_carterae.1